MVSFFDVFITVVFLLLLAVPGFIFEKLKMLPKTASEAISVLVLYGCQPVLVITSFQNCKLNGRLGVNMLLVAGIAAVIHLVMFAVCKVVFAKRSADDKIGLVKYLSVFSNCGFMGLPFLQSLFSNGNMQEEILVYCAVVIAVFPIFNWSFGVYIITGDKRQISVKKIFLNPVIISIIIGLLLLFVCQRPLIELAVAGSTARTVLEKFMGSLNYISNMVTPLSMFVIGIRLANIPFKQLLTNKWAYTATGMKLVVMPLITIVAVAWLPIAITVKYTVFFLLAMPCATSGTMMAVQFGKDGNFASISVVLSTILCILTLPLLFLLMNAIA